MPSPHPAPFSARLIYHPVPFPRRVQVEQEGERWARTYKHPDFIWRNLYERMTKGFRSPYFRGLRKATSGARWVTKIAFSRVCSRLDLYGFSFEGGLDFFNSDKDQAMGEWRAYKGETPHPPPISHTTSSFPSPFPASR